MMATEGCLSVEHSVNEDTENPEKDSREGEKCALENVMKLCYDGKVLWLKKNAV